MLTLSDPQIRHRFQLMAVGILTLSALLFGVRLGDREIVSEELRFAEVAREMTLTGDYLHPTLNGKSYYDKPLGSYWLIVVASHFTGGVNETAARFPAAIAGWLGVVCVMLLGRKLYDARTALWAGAILATCFSFAFYSRRATADIETVTGTLAAVTLFAHCRERKSLAWVVGLWFIMGLTSLTKGLLGFALPIAVLGTFEIWSTATELRTARGIVSRYWTHNRWFFNSWTLFAVPLGVGVFLVPYVLSGWQSGLEDGLALVYRENVKRFFQPHNHTGPITTYVPVLFVLAAPWGLLLPASLWPRRDSTDADRLVKAFFWGLFLFFTLSASRRSYYLLPILPAVALLVARLMTTPMESLRPMSRRLLNLGYLIVALGVSLSGVLLLAPADFLPPPNDQLPPLPARLYFAIGWLFSVIMVITAIVRPRFRAYGTLAVTMAGLSFALLVVLPATDDYRSRRSFVAGVNSAVSAEPDTLALYHARDLLFQLARPVPLHDFELAEEFHRATASGQVHWVIVRRRYLPQLSATTTALILEEGTYPWEGPDQLGDKMLLLKIVRP